MPQRILLLSPSDATRNDLCTILHDAGYMAATYSTLANPSAEEQPPALCIVDLELHKTIPQTSWTNWVNDCHATRTACLAFDGLSNPDITCIASLDPLCDTITNPFDRVQFLSKIHSLLTIRKLSRQLAATRHQLSHYQEALQDALESAAHIQRSLIPKSRPSYHNLQFAWQFMPCKQVGGDLFNIVQLDEETVMVYLVDVSGHGISSAMVTVSVHQSLSTHTGQLVKRPTEQPPFYEITSPARVLKELEAEYPFERFEEFFTISYILINVHTGELRYSNAGHPPPFLLRKDGHLERLDAGGTIIGVGEIIEFEEGENRLGTGDRIIMYTDGITEHVDSNGTPYGEQQFLNSLTVLQNRPLDEMPRNALISMREHGGNALPIDDVTLIGIEFRT